MKAYDGLERIAEDLYAVVGDFGRSPLRRRMTIVVTKGREAAGSEVVVHSAIRMEDTDMAKLDLLGPVTHIVIPNGFHTRDAPVYAERYPKAKVLAPAALCEKLSSRMRIDGSLEQDWPEAMAGQLACLPIGGTRTHESVFLHRPSRTLILTDLCFNLRGEYGGLTALLLRLNGSLHRFGPSRIMRWVGIKDWTDALASVRQVLEWDFDRIVVGHGDLVSTGGQAALRKAFAPYGL